MATPSRDLQQIVEFRKAKGLVAAEVLVDDANNYTAGDVFAIAGLQEVSKTTESSSDTHYYDDYAAIIVNTTGPDTINLNVSVIPQDVLAYITGQNYNAATGALIEGTRKTRYFAVGYITGNTAGETIYVWRYRGMFSVPDETVHTDDDSTDANGQTLVYTGIKTTHKFVNNPDDLGNPDGAKGMSVNVSKGLADVSTFFDTVTTPDTLVPVTPATMYAITNTLTHCTTNNTATSIVSGGAYAATITAAEGYTLGTVTVTMGGTDISSTAVSGGAITIPAVTGAVVITATATEQ